MDVLKKKKEPDPTLFSRLSLFLSFCNNIMQNYLLN